MAERLAEKYKSPEARGDESYNRDAHAAQVTDTIFDNAALLTGKCTFGPKQTVESFTATVTAGAVVVFDSSKVNAFGKPIVAYDVKTLIVSSDTISKVDILVEDEAGGVGTGPITLTLFLDANQTVTIPFAFGDRLQAGIIPPSPIVYRITAVTVAGTVSVGVSGLASI